MIKKSLAALFFALLTIGGMWLIGWVWFSAHVSHVKPQDPSTRTDAVIVLTGGPKRIETGIELLKAGLSNKLLISGVNDDVTLKDLVGTDETPCCITLGYTAKDTVENGIESAQWIKDQDVRSIRLVTSNYHIVRSHVVFRFKMPERKFILHPVRVQSDDMWSKVFWMTTFEEYNKTLATWMKLSVDKNRV